MPVGGGRCGTRSRQWARPVSDAPAAEWALLADAQHKRGTPVLYHVEDILEIWKRIAAPLLWVEGDRTDIGRWWGNRYTKDEFHQRLVARPSDRFSTSRANATADRRTSLYVQRVAMRT